LRALRREPDKGPVLRQLGVALLPVALVMVIALFAVLRALNPAAPDMPAADAPQVMGSEATSSSEAGLAEPEDTGGLAEPPPEAASEEAGVAEPPMTEPPVTEPDTPGAAPSAIAEPAPAAAPGAAPPPERGRGWVGWAVTAVALVGFYALLNFQRLEIFKLLLTSFFPLLIMILAVLGSIVFGLATPTEAAAVGAFGGYVLAAVYSVVNKRGPGQRRPVFLVWLLLWLPLMASLVWFAAHKQGLASEPVSPVFGAVAAGGVLLWALMAYRQARLQTEVRESVFLTAKTTAMVCWLFVGSAIFSAAFALLGGQDLVEKWVLGMQLSKTEFLILSQLIIFILGWPLEWTEIIVIFMPIFIPLLDHFGVDPLFFGLLVALNLQTAFLSPPVAMSAFYLKGVAPPHVTLNQIFAGMLPFMGIQIIAIVLLYIWPQIGLWLPKVLYG
ncbi:MAG: TRAP transporter large permease subunit, partial [Roseateles sp.]|uniref:TRAP transporter large permease subunit n=2 Tax=Roseateles sp. TaxID=1971397 RepID=UPI0040364B45